MATYDPYARTYDQTVAKGNPVIERSYQFITEALGAVDGLRLCDIGCGQGELARRLAAAGAQVTGVDLSAALLQLARERAGELPIDWVQDDAQQLARLGNGQFDVAVSNLMLMDLPDFGAVFAAAHRILVPGGRFLFTIMHPCFQSPDSEALDDGTGRLAHRRIARYEACHWRSGRPGTLGAYHRPLSDYLNTLIAAGFRLLRVDEPVIAADVPLEPDQQCRYTIPPILGVVAQRA